MQSTNATHSNILTPVCLEKRDRVPTQRLTIDGHNGKNYSNATANAHDEEVEELQAPELQVPFGLGGIGPQQPAIRRATKRMMYKEIKKLHKKVKFLEELIDSIFAADGVLAAMEANDNVVNVNPL